MTGALLLLVHAGLLAGSALALAGAGPWLRAALDGQAGPALAQPWRDLQRLARKGPVVAVDASWLHGVLPSLALASTAAAALLVPTFALGMATATLSDLVVVAGLLALGRCAAALAGWEEGAAGALSGDESMTLAAAAEPALVLVVLTAALLSGTANLDGAAAALREAGPRLPLLLAAPALGLVALADLGCLGGADGHASLARAYSGRGLALLGIAAAVRRVLWVALAASVLLPFGLAPAGAGPLALALGLAAWGAKLLLLGTGLTVAEAASASVAPGRVPGVLGVAALLALLGILVVFAGQRGA